MLNQEKMAGDEKVKKQQVLNMSLEMKERKQVIIEKD